MLQEYHRRIKHKPFAPILKDQSLKRWRSDLSMQTNISLLSISNSSKSNHNNEQYSVDKDSSSSQESIPSLSNEYQAKHIDLDPYILNKHLNKIPSTISNLAEKDIDASLTILSNDNKSSYQWQHNSYDPRSIQPPPFIEYLQQFRKPKIEIKPIQYRPTLLPVRTTKSEQLKLARLKSTLENISIQSSPRLTQNKTSANSQRHELITPSINHVSHTRTNSNSSSFHRLKSAQACKVALKSIAPLHFSSLLIKQMQEDIQNDRVPRYSKRLNSALLREQTDTSLNYDYKMKRVHHWLEKLISTDHIESNENISNESTLGTTFNDKHDLFFNEKLSDNTERTYAEAHRVLPIFETEVNHKMEQYNLLLTRLELDLYVI
ncbi:unnamed protein product [Adineta steineri]|uniref:Uncharacterized protein n=3 Tax=Adineta steineri TaxID=433720 RepID=A0A815R1F4_9BILA|nr:unnamed protein product [Adineta steineri]CAF3692715.1 unnamed protein product [Adineta steineri]